MNLAAVDYRPTEEYVYPAENCGLVFRLKTARRDFKTCSLLYRNRDCKNGSPFEKVSLQCFLRDGYHDYYTVKINLNKPAYYIKYYFELDTGNKKVWLNSDGIQKREPDSEYFEFAWANKNDGHVIPEWCSTQIYYQIFPERYKNGDRKNDPQSTVKWGSSPTAYNYMGGDIAGIIKSLDYISDLGVTCLYLTPVFKGTSNHKYDTVNYYEIDECFGSKQQLKDLVGECHKRRIRILLDGVFNHCGFYFPYFQDAVENGKKSKYVNWFFINGFPVKTEPPNYECVGNFKWMPKLNLENPEVMRYFINVGKYWIKETGIDGWRLDVADEIESSFWESFRKELKSEYPDIVLIGETWGDAGRLVLGNRLDSAMNYIFKDAVTDWVAKGTIRANTFDHRINYMLSHYSEETNNVMYNLIDSHDTSRFLYECHGDIRKMKIAVAFMMMFVGCPAIFYGDEIGLTGNNDPGCRCAMEWDTGKQNLELKDWYKKMILIRKSSPLFTKGRYMTNICGSKHNVFGFMRYLKNQSAYVVLNRSKVTREIYIPLKDEKGVFQEQITGSTLKAEKIQNKELFYNFDIADYKGLLKTCLPAYSVKIFLKKESGDF